jgi:hypothetical protein
MGAGRQAEEALLRRDEKAEVWARPARFASHGVPLEDPYVSAGIRQILAGAAEPQQGAGGDQEKAGEPPSR